MKPNSTIITRESDLGGEKIAMTVDTDSLAHIMGLLTELYSDPILAVIREYSTNAIDSHIAAGVSLPIEVTTPGPLSMVFRVRDYGVGLSADEIRFLYSKYGASTKRDSDDYNGTLGLGCKSGLAYTNSFQLVGIKDGIKTIAAISRLETGAGVIEIVDESPTDEATGVEVIVPAHREGDFLGRALNFFRFWEPGTVLLNGVEPPLVDGIWVADNICIVDKSDAAGNVSYRENFVVMGNVAYPADTDLYYTGYPDRTKVVVFADMGEVNFTPSREALMMTERTKTFIKDTAEVIREKMAETITANVAAAPTGWDCLNIMERWYSKIDERWVTKLGLKYKGLDIPTRFTLAGSGVMWNGTYGVRSRWASATNGYQAEDILRVRSSSQGRVFIVNAPVDSGLHYGAGLSAYNKQKFTTWAAATGTKHAFLISDSGFDQFWLDRVPVIEWEDIKAVSVGKQRAAASGDYTVQRFFTTDELVAGKHRGPVDVKVDEIDLRKKIIYFNKAHRSRADADLWRVCSRLVEDGMDAEFYEVAPHRVAKFKRNIIGATSIDVAIERYMNRIYNVAKKCDLRGYFVHEDDRTILDWIGDRKIDDPLIQEIQRFVALGVDLPDVEKYNKVRRMMIGMCEIGFANDDDSVVQSQRLWEKWPTITETLPDGVKVPSGIRKKYPLITANDDYGLRWIDDKKEWEDHLVIYMNAAYAANKEEGNV